MKRESKETLQTSMFDLTWKPIKDYWTTAADIDKILRNTPVKKVIEPVIADRLVEALQKPKPEEETIDKENSIPVPFVFYDTGLVDAHYTKKKYSIKSCIEFYFHVLDWKPWYAKFWKQLENIEKYFSRFFGWDWDKKYLRENMWFKRNWTDKGTIEGRERQDRTNQLKIAISKIKWVRYDRWWIYAENWEMERKDKFVDYPHEERIPRITKWMNNEGYIEETATVENDWIVVWEVKIDKTLKEIELSRNAGFDEEWWLAGFVPFCFDRKRNVNHRETIEKYTLKECINFYLKVINKESNYWKFSNLLIDIEAYFTNIYKWDGNIESLVKYKDIVSKISNSCSDKVIIWLNGELDLYSMNTKFGEKDTLNYVENILKNKEPFNDFIVLGCLNKFLEREWLSNAMNVFNKNKENLIYFFKVIVEKSEKSKFTYNIESLWGNIWDSYKIFFDKIFKSFDEFLKNRNENYYDKTFFDSEWYNENSSLDWDENIRYRDTIWDIINDLYLDWHIIENIRSMDFLYATFASLRKSRREVDLDSVYKKNLIRVYMSDRWKTITIRWWIEQDKTISLKEMISESFYDLEYKNWYIYDKNLNKIDKNQIIEHPMNDWSGLIQQWILRNRENKDILPEKNIWTIEFLNNIIDDLQLRWRLEIDDREDHLCDKETWEILNLIDLFQEERDFWKMHIIERIKWTILDEELNLQPEKDDFFWFWPNTEDEDKKNSDYQKSDDWDNDKNDKDDKDEDDGDDEDDDLPF